MSKNIVVLDYGSGNIRSVQKGLQKVGANVVVSNDFSLNAVKVFRTEYLQLEHEQANLQHAPVFLFDWQLLAKPLWNN